MAWLGVGFLLFFFFFFFVLFFFFFFFFSTRATIAGSWDVQTAVDDVDILLLDHPEAKCSASNWLEKRNEMGLW